MPQPRNLLASRRQRPAPLAVLASAEESTAWDIRWVSWLQQKQNLGQSPNSIRICRYNAKRIDIFREDHGITDVRQFDPSAVEKFRVELDASGLTKSSVKQHMVTLRSFLNTVDVWQVSKHGMSPVPRLTEQDWRIEFFTPEETDLLRRVVRQPHNQASRRVDGGSIVTEVDRRRAARDAMMLEVLLRTGIRQTELIDLTIHDFPASTLNIRGKGRRARPIPMTTLGKDLGRELRRYVTVDRPKSTSDRLFVSSRQPHGPITKAVLIRFCLNLEERSGLDVFTHKFRHTFATECLRANMSLPVLRDLLGHSTLEMVMRYAHVTGILLRDEMARMPL